MKLSKEILENLKIAGDDSVVSEECFRTLLRICYSNIVANTTSLKLPDDILHKTPVKHAYGALLFFLVEASRFNSSPEALDSLLKRECNFSSPRSHLLVQFYLNNKSRIRGALNHIGVHPPHVTDVRWEMDYCVKVSNVDLAHEEEYNIQFEIESCPNKLEKEKSHITFSCSLGELQNLVWKLKEAVKHLERISVK